MRKIIITIGIIFGLLHIVSAQNKITIINANNKIVSIKDGKNLKKNYWTITPEAKPDVYVTFNKKVTFYTDTDSITVKVNDKKDSVNFIILLNGKDSALTQVRYHKPYIEVLRKGEKYNSKDNRLIPAFTYQSKDDSNLVKLRQSFHLDSVAGQGNEVSQIINLMHWVHNIVRHDGSSSNPELKNAIDLIKICHTENRGVNCRMMATILNECYLAMGFPSRFVTCMPRETNFDDCHVINMVYSRDLKKWIWMDPTFDAYVMDEKGNLLGLEDVRERLIKGKMLILNPDANWNRKISQTKAEYLETYMSKNLYRMQCLSASSYNSETLLSGQIKYAVYVELLPLDGIEQTPQKVEKNSKSIRYVAYKINNQSLFWTKPE
ncbi:MAG: transglutaminase-like domain-containing protein [Paludibacter sp.]|nr:transglutaminase-like domain-containing protein [Paludibacter sp.]